MDLRIEGRKAIVCASSDGLGRACAEALGSDRAKVSATIPAGRFGDPSEFGDICAFLCGVSAAYITGQNILIDGGFCMNTL